MDEKIKILICDDHAIFREGLKNVLAADSRLEVVGEAADGLSAVQQASKLEPDLVIMDIAMPEMSGVEATREIVKAYPHIRVIILSMHSRKAFIMEALKAGARGYVLKDSAGEKILQSVQAVLKGDSYLDSPVAAHIVDEFVKMPDVQTGDDEELPQRLSERERQVLRLIVDGNTNKDIADKLFISPKTVENHRTNIMAKLGLHDVIDMVKYAISSGLIDLDSWTRS